MRFNVVAPSPQSFAVARKVTLARLAAAAARAVDTTVVNTKRDLSGAMAAAGLGKLSKVIRSTSDYAKKRVPPIGDGSGRWRAGGVIYAAKGSPRTEGAVAAYTQGVTTIIPRRGRWLAFATDEIPKRVGRRRMTPELYLASGFEKRIGKLHFIPSKAHPGEAFLIAKRVQVDAARGFGRSLRLPKHGRARLGRKAVDFIVCFILIRVTVRTRRVDPRAIMAARVRDLPTEIRKLLRGAGPQPIGGPVIASSAGSFTQG